MQSKNSPDGQEAVKRSFIEEARRAQIISASIETLAELGYGRASLAQIAKRAGISTSLISYHFKDKDDLMLQTLLDIWGTWEAAVRKEVATCETAADKLRVYIEANLAYMGTRINRFAALIEIEFNARDEEGVLLYRRDLEEPEVSLLEQLLTDGQARGEFRAFNVKHMTVAIRATIDQFMGLMHAKPDMVLEDYATEIVEVFYRATRKDAVYD
jgi:TetR/AcrR family transcriptional regulator, transcriptional repressor of bet genes